MNHNIPFPVKQYSSGVVKAIYNIMYAKQVD